MSSIALLGAVELGLVFGLVGLGVYLSFRVLSFPDLTVDGSFPLGGGVAAALIVADADPWLATLAAAAAGGVAGLVTGWLNVRLKILHLLASILTMIALFSVNLRIMGRPNVALLGEPTVFTPFEWLGLPFTWLQPLVFLAVAVLATLLVDLYLLSEVGLALRATGANPRVARAQGVHTDRAVLAGLAVSNALVGLAGALFAQSQGGADVSMGIGIIVVGLAAVIVGETLVPGRGVVLGTLACVVGSLVYRLVIALALNADVLGLKAQDLNLVTAVLVALALTLPNLRRALGPRVAGGRS